MSVPKSEIQVHLNTVQLFQRIGKPSNYDEQLRVITNVIETNFMGCDMVLTLFLSALNSSRSYNSLRPFPPSFIKDYSKNIPALRNFCSNIPPLRQFLTQPSAYLELVELFWWLFIDKGFPVLQCIPFISDILPGNVPESFKPNYVFRIIYSDKADEIFNARRAEKNLISAYHGSLVVNFYSILKVGLQQHFSSGKENLFGKGIYLSNEYSVSGNYSPYQLTWKNSSLGTRHSIIALCNIIDDVTKVKYKDSENRTRSVENMNDTEGIPEKYFVVTDSDMVRLKYLLVYKKNEIHYGKSFFRKNLVWLALLLYVVFLFFIGSDKTFLKKYVKYLIEI
ncbi:hypothetical protein WA026_008739 [Henosepilachna vigintioctopunctata]|uniref:PARP n=1 Tax=Henosepilachna vigintioctopunctata TaxID=420089 RepID=A0AAW1V2K8_9CUCU